MPIQTDRYFLVGETVYVRVKVSVPGTKTPTDPDALVLVSLIKSGTISLISVPGAFTRINEGDYVLGIATDALATGTYNILVRAKGPLSDTPVKVVLVQDRFILKPA